MKEDAAVMDVAANITVEVITRKIQTRTQVFLKRVGFRSALFSFIRGILLYSSAKGSTFLGRLGCHKVIRDFHSILKRCK